MKTIVLALILVFIFVGCDSGNDNDRAGGNNIIDETIVGTWKYTYPASQCSETNIFNDDNTFTINSLDEVQTGTYVFESPVNVDGRYKVTLTFLSDNGLSSCTGDTTDSTGQVGSLYAEFATADQILWYASSSGGTPLGTFNRVPVTDTCGFKGQISGELNYTVNHDITDGCGGAPTPDSELITSYGGIGSEPSIKIYLENFQPGIVANNRTAHIVIHKGLGDDREWQTALGACTVNIVFNENNINTGQVKVSGNGSCNSPALPDTNSGATSNISIAPFTFESMWLHWP